MISAKRCNLVNEKKHCSGRKEKGLDSPPPLEDKQSPQSSKTVCAAKATPKERGRGKKIYLRENFSISRKFLRVKGKFMEMIKMLKKMWEFQINYEKQRFFYLGKL